MIKRPGGELIIRQQTGRWPVDSRRTISRPWSGLIVQGETRPESAPVRAGRSTWL